MRRLFKVFDEDGDVRVVVIRAEGKSFTAGLDLVAAQSLLGDGSAVYREELRRKIIDLQSSMTAIENCRKPVIAAIHGHCIGGGVDLTSACDIRLASKDAVFSIREHESESSQISGPFSAFLTLLGRAGSGSWL